MPNFRVELQQETLVFVGHLEDSTEFDLYRRLCARSNALDFKPLYSFSWVGMQKLMAFLSDLHQSFRVVGAAPSVARMLLLVAKKYKIAFETIDVDVVNPSADEAQTVSFSELVELIRLQGEHVFLPNGRRLRGLGHLYSNGVLDVRETPPMSPSWSTTAAEEIRFWYDYVAFSRSVVEAAGFALKAALVLNEEIAHQKLGMIRKAFQAYKALGKSDDRYSFSALTEAFGTVQEINDGCMTKVEASLKLVDSIQNEIELLLISDFGSYERCINALSRLGELGEYLSRTASMLDDTGVRLGEISFSFQFAGEWLGDMAENLLPSADEKSVNSVLSKLKMEEDEAAENGAVALALRVKGSIEEGMMRCLVAAQQFDSVRQIMEHRANEAAYLVESWEVLKNGSCDWLNIRAELLSRIEMKLVTDIEKLSFEYHFPKERISLGKKG